MRIGTQKRLDNIEDALGDVDPMPGRVQHAVGMIISDPTLEALKLARRLFAGDDVRQQLANRLEVLEQGQETIYPAHGVGTEKRR